MRECYFKEYSNFLERDMEYAVFGSEGKICLAFIEQDGHYYDYKNFGMIEAISPWIEKGIIKVVCVDSIDKETWSFEAGDPHKRIELHEKWYHYVIDELLPKYLPKGEKAMATGVSMGGFHAANVFFRRPDLFDIFLSLSGVFNADFFMHGYMDSLVYDNSPVHYLSNMPDDHPWRDLYEKSTIIACAGHGPFEEILLEGTEQLDRVLQEKNITHWFDYWGYDVTHDWCWWHKQMKYFLTYIFGEA